MFTNNQSKILQNCSGYAQFPAGIGDELSPETFVRTGARRSGKACLGEPHRFAESPLAHRRGQFGEVVGQLLWRVVGVEIENIEGFCRAGLIAHVAEKACAVLAHTAEDNLRVLVRCADDGCGPAQHLRVVARQLPGLVVPQQVYLVDHLPIAYLASVSPDKVIHIGVEAVLIVPGPRLVGAAGENGQQSHVVCLAALLHGVEYAVSGMLLALGHDGGAVKVGAYPLRSGFAGVPEVALAEVEVGKGTCDVRAEPVSVAKRGRTWEVRRDSSDLRSCDDDRCANNGSKYDGA